MRHEAPAQLFQSAWVGTIDGAALDLGDVAELFVTNVLNGTVAGNGSTVNQGTVVRFVITSTDGDKDDHGNKPRELFRTVIGSGFGQKTDPDALVNAGDGNLVETTPGGGQVNTKAIDTSGAGEGTPFGLAVKPRGKGIVFVDDGDNTLDLLH